MLQMNTDKEINRLKELLIAYSRNGEGLITKALRKQIQKLETKNSLL